MRSFAAAAVLFVPLVLVSCTEEAAGPLAERREPASISISAADLELNDGDTLQVFANLLDQHDNVFSNLPEGVAIEWSSEDESIVEVRPDGRVIGNAPGVTTIHAEADGHEAEATVAVRAVAREVVVVEGPSEDGGLPSTPLPDSVVLRVIDRHGNGVGGAEVRFRVTSGGGSVSPSSAISDAGGLVRVQWTLGPVIGAQAIQAFAPGAGLPVAIETTISQVIFGGFDGATDVTQGGVLPVTVRLDSNLFPTAVGAAHLVVSWDPAKLSMVAATAGDYVRGEGRLAAAAGELHLISSDPAMTRGDMAAAELTFDVIGGAGTTTTISLAIEQLVGVNFLDASPAGIAEDIVVNIN